VRFRIAERVNAALDEQGGEHRSGDTSKKHVSASPSNGTPKR
jgi:hypothetical protein